MSYIEREALLDFLEKHRPVNWSDTDREIQAQKDYKMFVSCIENAPPADVKPVKQAYWEHKDKKKDDEFHFFEPAYWTCSNCGVGIPVVLGGPFGKYCFNCGSKMDVKSE